MSSTPDMASVVGGRVVFRERRDGVPMRATEGGTCPVPADCHPPGHNTICPTPLASHLPDNMIELIGLGHSEAAFFLCYIFHRQARGFPHLWSFSIHPTYPSVHRLAWLAAAGASAKPHTLASSFMVRTHRDGPAQAALTALRIPAKSLVLSAAS